MDIWRTIADDASAESGLWAGALLPNEDRERVPVFSPLADERHAFGLETIYEGYLLHYGRPRLFSPADADTGLLLGDYLYAHGLVRIAELGEIDAIRELAQLISACAHLRAEGLPGDGEAWVQTATRLGDGAPPRAAVDRALAAHSVRVAR